jgi:hypothetical protein
MSGPHAGAPAPQPSLAYWLSIFMPGLGLLYAGAPARGIAVFAAAFLGFAGVIYGIEHGARRPEYIAYGMIGAALLAAAWWGGASHARSFASRQTQWPALYRFFGDADVRQALRAARAELGMALFFGCLTALLFMWPSPPQWLPHTPRYWFLYEVFGAFYLAVFHAAANAARMRTAGFFVITLVFTASLALFSRLSRDALIIAFLLALPSCWFSLRHRADEAVRMHLGRFFFCLIAGYASLFAFAIIVGIWEALSGQPQYRMRLIRDENLVFAVFGLIYYLVRSGFEVLIHHSTPRTVISARSS